MEKIYEIVKNIPFGKVATYGGIAQKLGNKKLARYVGNCLHKNPNPNEIPCYRIVNCKGKLSKNFAFGGIEKQAELLKKEGVKINANFVVDRDFIVF